MPALATVDENDRRWLTYAFARAATDPTRTSPNPRVGCVVVAASGALVGVGVSQAAGGPHAEVLAVRHAGDAADGATAYVTLEPCNHHGRTPPCTDMLQAANIHRVVFGHADPNPIARGGADTLHAAGIACAGPLAAHDPLARVIADELAGFFRMTGSDRPHVTLKLAQSANGDTHPQPGQYITGRTARRSVHRMRAAADCVLVGSGTVAADDPALTVRDTGTTLMTAHQPDAVILDRRLRLSPEAAVCRPGTRLITSRSHEETVLAPYRARGMNISTIPLRNDRDDLCAALATLATAGVTEVFAEPGVTLARAMCDAQVVDRLVLHVSGGTAAPFVPCVPLDGMQLEASGRFDDTDAWYVFAPEGKQP